MLGVQAADPAAERPFYHLGSIRDRMTARRAGPRKASPKPAPHHGTGKFKPSVERSLLRCLSVRSPGNDQRSKPHCPSIRSPGMLQRSKLRSTWPLPLDQITEDAQRHRYRCLPDRRKHRSSSDRKRSAHHATWRRKIQTLCRAELAPLPFDQIAWNAPAEQAPPPFDQIAWNAPAEQAPLPFDRIAWNAPAEQAPLYRAGSWRQR